MPTFVTIADKDGGIAAELRPQIGALPVYLPGSGDGRGRQYWDEEIHITSTGDQTVHTVPAGKRFFIDSIVLEVQQAGTALRLKSGASNNISGVIRMAANSPLSATHGYEAQLKGRNNDENFVVNVSGDYFTPYVSGWVTGYDEAT